MAEKAASGRQLFFDLIAAAGESQAPSAFESAAWAVAAEHPLAKTAQSAPAETHGPDSESLPDRTTDRIDRHDMERPESEEFVGLQLIDDEAQPPLAKIDPAPVAAGNSAPGPRISAFAAATGAAIAPTPRRPDTDPLVASSMVEQAADERPATLSSPTPASAARPRVESIEPSGPRGYLVDLDPPSREQIRADRTESTSPEGGGVLLAADDDFGPLVLPEPTRRSRRRSRDASRPQESGARDRHPRRAGVAVGVLLLALACLGVWWVTARPSATPTESPSDVAMVDWRGIALPVSSSAGPTEVTETRASGFVRSSLGAAIAAAHLSVRVDPAAGPGVFEPVLADQVVGARDRLADAVRAQSEAGPADGAPGALMGWRLDGDAASNPVTTHLAVVHADGTRADYAIPLAWAAGDWRIDAPRSGQFFPITDLSGTYEPFVEEVTS